MNADGDAMRRVAIGWRRCLARLCADVSAATALEFALILPVLVFVTFGIMDLGCMMFAAEEFNFAAAAAIRQIRTGAVQAAYQSAQTNGSSNYAGDADCKGATQILVNFASTTTNCLGFNISSSDTGSTIFGKLLCANLLVGGQGSGFLSCANFNWTVNAYGCFEADQCSNPVNISAATLSYNANGTSSAQFTTPGSTAIIVALIGYRYPFFTPLIGCFIDPADCAARTQTKANLTYFQVVEAEPF